MLDLSIIIVNYNSKNYLVDCLQSIERQTSGVSIEVWVVDNNSKDGSPEEVRKSFPKVRLIQNPDNPGFSTSLNKALSKMEGRYALLLNPDTLILESAIDRMFQFMENNSKVGILGPKVYDNREKTSLQHSCRSFPSLHNVLFHRYSLLTKLFPGNPWSRKYLLSDWDHQSTREVDWLSGCCMMLRKQVIEEIGYFDEAFFMFSEDVDYCYRTGKAGWKVFYFPEAEVVHFIGASKGKVKPRIIIERHKSIRHYLRKHCIKNPFLAILIDLVIFLRGGGMLLLNVLKS